LAWFIELLLTVTRGVEYLTRQYVES